MAIVGIDNPASATAQILPALPADAFAGATADDFAACLRSMRWARMMAHARAWAVGCDMMAHAQRWKAGPDMMARCPDAMGGWMRYDGAMPPTAMEGMGQT
ncbi:MAG: hypothetical protein CM15mP54_14180 [Paracoccaceae bacterium]|nr:MAG: hypothetical protein CM15mP54_14180 [Paracoccaceae bacterium]